MIWSFWGWICLLVVSLGSSEGLIHSLELSSRLCKKLPQKVPSREAANLLREYYDRQNENSKNHELFLITSDASSHGANRHVGLSSFIRQISPPGFLGNDRVWVQYKRQQKLKQRHSGELPAIMLGIKKLLHEDAFQVEKPISVWILTDCQAAMDFFIKFGDSNNSNFVSTTTSTNNLIKLGNKPKRKRKKKSVNTLVQDSYRRYISTLLQKCTDVCIVKVRSTHSHEMGFLDHSLADVLSRSSISGLRFDTNNANDEDFCQVPSLQNDPDLMWLETSEDDKDESDNLPHHAARKRASGERIEYCKKILLQQFYLNVDKE